MQLNNWNDLRAFRTVAQSRQLARAGRLLNVDPTTIGRRLTRLETQLGVTLFERRRDGQVLTEAGEALLAKVEVMANAAMEIFENDSTDSSGLKGQIRLSVSEGFGSWFLAKRLPELAAAHPNLTIELVANSGFLSPSKREADIAIMLSRPRAGPLIARKLSDYSLMLYAAPNYLAGVDKPEHPSDLANGHRLIGYIPDLLYAPELAYLNEFHTGLTASLRSSSINAQHRLLSEGAGIGVLPCFIGDVEPMLTRVLPAVSVRRSFWIVTHKDNHKLAKIRFLSDWLSKSVRSHRSLLSPTS